jgi:D-alanyl-D-alanine dipeptidase
LSASPPHEVGEFRAPDLVDLAALDPTIKLDIRYATSNNFLGTPLYTSARAFLQRPAAEALRRAHQALEPLGYGLLIHDAYRPWHVTKLFWEATPESGHAFVANPAEGSKHNRGAAVDLTLYDRATGQPVAMVGGYDEFSPRSNPDYPGGTDLQRWQRDLLRRSMEEQGFTVNAVEWWHFDHRDWAKYPILNRRFEELGSAEGGR